jgi:hypothetical protein
MDMIQALKLDPNQLSDDDCMILLRMLGLVRPDPSATLHNLTILHSHRQANTLPHPIKLQWSACPKNGWSRAHCSQIVAFLSGLSNQQLGLYC